MVLHLCNIPQSVPSPLGEGQGEGLLQSVVTPPLPFRSCRCIVFAFCGR